MSKDTLSIDRNRSAAGLSVDEAHHDGIVMADPRDPNGAVEQERVRVPLNTGEKLSLRGMKLDTKNFHHKWVYEHKDYPGQVQAYKNAFYEHVADEQGHHMIVPAGNGAHYLMKLPMKYHIEDHKAAKDQRDALRKRQAAVDRNKGEYAPTADGRREGGESAVVSRSVSDNPLRGGKNENPYA
ncbi:MAG: hypothetical protein V4563_17600 [Pseudomonadota bacterium]